MSLLYKSIIRKKNPILKIIRNFSEKKAIIPIVHEEIMIKNNENIKTLDAITKDKGLSKFIQRTYTYTGVGIVSTLIASQTISTILSPSMYLPVIGIGIGIAVGGIMGISNSKYEVHQKKIIIKSSDSFDRKVDYWYSENSEMRLGSYAAMIMGMSLTISPMVIMINEISPTILPASVILSCGVFGGSTLYVNLHPKGSLLSWHASLMRGLSGLIGIQLIGLGSYLILGPNILSMSLHSIDTYGGLVLFTGMVAYDTHKAIEMYEQRDPDHLGCAINFYLDFINILIRIMEIMAKMNDKK